MLYEMLSGLPPFYDTNRNVMYEKILTSTLRFPEHVPPVTRNFLSHLLDRNPKTRFGSLEAGTDCIKNHPFFKHIDWVCVGRVSAGWGTLCLCGGGWR